MFFLTPSKQTQRGIVFNSLIEKARVVVIAKMIFQDRLEKHNKNVVFFITEIFFRFFFNTRGSIIRARCGKEKLTELAIGSFSFSYWASMMRLPLQRTKAKFFSGFVSPFEQTNPHADEHGWTNDQSIHPPSSPLMVTQGD